MDAKFDAVIGVLGDAKQLDAVAEFFGKLNVFGFQMCNAFDMNFSISTGTPKAIAERSISL